MKAVIEVFWGAEPEVGSEKEFLAQLKADLKRHDFSATILANFFTNSSSRQIDFLVVTDNHACHVELKGYDGVLVGAANGPWSMRRDDGALEVIDRQNPYTQAFQCKMAISDNMHTVAAKHNRTMFSPAPRKKFYTQFDSAVCVFPRLADDSQVPSDYKVQTLGYADFLTFLMTPGRRPD